VTVFSATKKREPCIAVLARQCWIWIDPSTDWIGLDWIGLDWIGWNGMDWIGLGWIGLDWIGLGGMDWIGLGGMTVFFRIMIYELLAVPVLSRLKVSIRIGRPNGTYGLRVRFNTRCLWIGMDRVSKTNPCPTLV